MIIDGKKISGTILQSLKEEIKKLPGRAPCLKVILVGNSPASKVYVTRKKESADSIGIDAEVIFLPENTSENELLDRIKFLNNDNGVDGIIVQLPLPKTINTSKILEAVDPYKDVDGFNPINQGKLLAGTKDGFVPATPLGIQTLLLACHIPLTGKRVVIVGRSAIVGKPLFALLSNNGPGGDATVTLAHSKTKNLPHVTLEADILIVAVGSPQLITKDFVKKGAVVIDVGINKVGTTLVGDVKFDEVREIASFITPVPGGVGPMTIASLLSNTLKARKMYGKYL